MKAVTYERYGGPEVLHLTEKEKPVSGEGEVLVRIRASSINAADYRMMRADPFLVRFFNGLFRPGRQALGSDIAGVVQEIGPGVTARKVGDEVFGSAFEDGGGGFAEFVSVRASAVTANSVAIA